MRLWIAGVAIGTSALIASGCVHVQTQVTRTIQVHKDADGKITGFTEIESATQMGAALPFSGFQYLKGGPKETEPFKLY